MHEGVPSVALADETLFWLPAFLKIADQQNLATELGIVGIVFGLP